MRRSNRLSSQRYFVGRKAECRRHGVLTAWSVIAMVVCLACVTLAVNSAYVAGLRAEGNRCAQTAALSAARVLLSDDILKPDLQLFEVDARYLRARQAAKSVHRIYRSQTNLPDFHDRSVAIGTLVSTPDGAMLLQHSMVPNFVQVVLSNVADANGVGADRSGTLLLAGASTVSQAKLFSRARVSIQNRLIGFRPTSDCPIPMLGLAIPDAPNSSIAGQWSSDIEANTGGDRFEYSGLENTVSYGVDRLPEIVISIDEGSQSGGPGKGRWISYFQSDFQDDLNVADWTSGISGSEEDSESLLTFPASATSCFLRNSDLDSMAVQFRSVIGQPFIFPLYELPVDVSGTTVVAQADSRFGAASELTLTRVIAARIVNVALAGTGELQVTLQPCVISTATAVTTSDSAVPANRYVWRIGASG
ncbi:MAG: hypothetical protein WAO83_03215 [Fuerstiella sp.]